MAWGIAPATLPDHGVAPATLGYGTSHQYWDANHSAQHGTKAASPAGAGMMRAGTDCGTSHQYWDENRLAEHGTKVASPAGAGMMWRRLAEHSPAAPPRACPRLRTCACSCAES